MTSNRWWKRIRLRRRLRRPRNRSNRVMVPQRGLSLNPKTGMSRNAGGTPRPARSSGRLMRGPDPPLVNDSRQRRVTASPPNRSAGTINPVLVVSQDVKESDRPSPMVGPTQGFILYPLPNSRGILAAGSLYYNEDRAAPVSGLCFPLSHLFSKPGEKILSCIQSFR